MVARTSELGRTQAEDLPAMATNLGPGKRELFLKVFQVGRQSKPQAREKGPLECPV